MAFTIHRLTYSEKPKDIVCTRCTEMTKENTRYSYLRGWNQRICLKILLK